MSTEQNEAIVRRWFNEGWNSHNPDVADELFAPDFRSYNPVDPHRGETPGPGPVKDTLRKYLDAFPDLHITLDDVLAVGDKVATRWTWRGTHRGEFLGAPPTGQQTMATGVHIHRVAGGKIVEVWGSVDGWSALQQLGMVPGTRNQG